MSCGVWVREIRNRRGNSGITLISVVPTGKTILSVPKIDVTLCAQRRGRYGIDANRWIAAPQLIWRCSQHRGLDSYLIDQIQNRLSRRRLQIAGLGGRGGGVSAKTPFLPG